MFKNQKGFTLIEVIVVAVIVAILAAVAIPIYNAYVNSSRQNVVNNTAGSLATFCATSREQGQNVTPSTYAANTPIPGAQGTTWQVPVDITAVVAASQVTITHTKDNTKTRTVNY